MRLAVPAPPDLAFVLREVLPDDAQIEGPQDRFLSLALEQEDHGLVDRSLRVVHAPDAVCHGIGGTDVDLVLRAGAALTDAHGAGPALAGCGTGDLDVGHGL